MVWISNQSSATIIVSITDKTGGDSSEYNVFSKPFESWPANHWSRGGDETATVKYTNGKTFKFTVGKDKFVNVYEDAVVLFDSEAIRVP